jgi:hypothetical protein
MAKRVRAARHYQSKDAPLRLMADNAILGIKRDVKGALKHLGTLLPRNALDYARAGDWYGLRRDIDWTHFRQVMKAPFARIGKVREAAAQHGVKKINGTFAQARRRVRFRKQEQSIYSLDALFEKDIGDQYAFDLYDEETQARIRQAQDDLIAQLDGTARDTIEQIVINGAQEGLSPDDIVDDIRAMISLTDRQAQAVMNYRDMLENLDSGALERQLRNGEYDQALQNAIDSGEDLSAAMIDQMVSDYQDNFLDYRAEMIATTEATRAASAGLQDAYSQAIDRGVFPAEAVTQFWQIAGDENVCEICQSCADMNEDGVAIGEMFDSIDGPQEAPPDPHPSCRCSIEVVTNLDMVPDDAVDSV